MCLTLSECNEMIEVAKKNDKLLFVFHNRRYDGDFLTVKHLIEKKITW